MRICEDGQMSEKDLETWQKIAEITQKSADAAFQIMSMIRDVKHLKELGLKLQGIHQ